MPMGALAGTWRPGAESAEQSLLSSTSRTGDARHGLVMLAHRRLKGNTCAAALASFHPHQQRHALGGGLRCLRGLGATAAAVDSATRVLSPDSAARLVVSALAEGNRASPR